MREERNGLRGRSSPLVSVVCAALDKASNTLSRFTGKLCARPKPTSTSNHARPR
jgi:hypothetical protein